MNADVLLPFPDEPVPLHVYAVVLADVLGIFVVGFTASDEAIFVLVVNESETLALGLRKAVLVHLADDGGVDLTPGLADVFVPQLAVHLDLLAEGGVPDEVVMLVVLAGKTGVLADHDGLAGVDVPEHTDDENGLPVVALVVTGKYASLCHTQPSLR